MYAANFFKFLNIFSAYDHERYTFCSLLEFYNNEMELNFDLTFGGTLPRILHILAAYFPNNITVTLAAMG